MNPESNPRARPRASRVIAGTAAAIVLAGGVGLLATRGIDPRALLGAIGARGAGARPVVSVGAVTNGAGVGGDAVLRAARDGLNEAVGAQSPAPSARGARVVRRGHIFDANVVRVERSPGRVRVEASVVVSTMPGRRYEFASTSAVTLTGGAVDGESGLVDATRRAMRSAAGHAVEQLGAR